MFATWVVCIIIAIFWQRSTIVAILAVLVAYGYGIFLCQYLIPQQDNTKNLKPLVDIYQEYKRPGAELIVYGDAGYSLNYYDNDKFKIFTEDEKDQFSGYIQTHPMLFIIVDRRHEYSLLRVLQRDSSQKWYYISKTHPDYRLITNIKVK